MRYILVPLAFLTTSAVANPLPQDGSIESLLIPISHTETQFNGVVRAGGCSGALISGNNDEAPAYVLTAGHCFGDFNGGKDKGKVIYDGTVSLNIITNDYPDRPDSLAREEIPVQTVRFATMNLTDLAVLELGTTVGALKSKYNFYKVADAKPAQGTSLVHVGFPGGRPMTKSDLVAQSPAIFTEAWGHEIEFAYEFTGATMGGYSGSPNFDSTNTIYGVTTQMNNPNVGYSQFVDGINGCFTSSGTFDFKLSTCMTAYKKRFYERFAVALPGFEAATVPDDKKGSVKFGEGLDPNTKKVEGKVGTPGPAETPKINGAIGSSLSKTFAVASVITAMVLSVVF